MANELNIIGKPRRRVDARAKVTGQTTFADDIVLPRMAYCKLLRSPHPHARIRSISTARALASPGVYLVLTGKDLPIEYGIMPVSQDENALCRDRVRFVGDPVAAVVAREVTKVHEEFCRGRITELIESFERTPPRGEITVIVARADDRSALSASSNGAHAKVSLPRRVEEIMKAQNLSHKAALKIAARERGLSKREAYKQLLVDRNNH